MEIDNSTISFEVDTLEENSVFTPFTEFLETVKKTLQQIYRGDAGAELLNLERGIPPGILSKFMSLNPLSVCIPEENGGRGGKMAEIMALVSAASYESLALSLTIGINSALFIQPVAKYANKATKSSVFKRFLNEMQMGGLMITEPDFGSDALNMKTFHTEKQDVYHIKGTKHWAGLTGWANYWLLTARKKAPNGDLKRDIDFFVCDRSAMNQQIVVEEYFDNIGLYQIPYGRNILDVEIPKMQKLTPKTTGINLLLDLLHRSRLQFPAMGLGFIQRMMDEAIEHCKQRNVGGKSLFQYDQVQLRLARLQASYTTLSALCAESAIIGGIDYDLESIGLVANSVKTVSTDLMQEAAQSLVQLVGAKAYRNNHIAGRGMADSRPFQIFEGSNDILYIQISEALLKLMKKANVNNLYQFMLTYEPTQRAACLVKKALDFDLNSQISQRRLVELGKVIANIVCAQIVIKLGEKGFRNDLIENCLEISKKEIIGLLGCFQASESTLIIEDYQQNSSWFNLV